MKNSSINNFWYQRSKKYKNKIEGVLFKSLPRLINNHIHNWMTNSVKNELSKTSEKILDLGCGYGRISKEIILENNKYIFGVDISEEYIKYFNANMKKSGKGYVSDIKKLPFSSRSIDYAFAVTVLMYLLDDMDVEKSVKEINRVIKKGSKVVIIEPNKLGQNIITLWGLISKQSNISRVFENRKLSKIIEKNGFEIKKISGMPFFTLMLLPILFFYKISPFFSSKVLWLVNEVDKKISKFYYPSLYLIYVAIKK